MQKLIQSSADSMHVQDGKLVITVAADAPAPYGAGASAGTMNTTI